MPCRNYWALVEISASPGCTNTLTSGKGFMKSFCRTCQELLGRNNTPPKKSYYMSRFLPLISLLGNLTWRDLRNRSVSLGFPEAQFPWCCGKVPARLSPPARLSQHSYRASKHTEPNKSTPTCSPALPENYQTHGGCILQREDACTGQLKVTVWFLIV